jgi:anaerobic selenocysteine-containing dehydrogenase
VISKSGDRARVFNNLGEVFCKVLIDDRVREGVVLMPKGVISEAGGGACFNDARVEVEKA